MHPVPTHVKVIPLSTSLQSGTIITIITVITVDEPTLIHNNHSKSIIYITFHFWGVNAMNLNKCPITCVNYGTIQSILRALKIFCSLPIDSSKLNLWNHWSLYHVVSFVFRHCVAFSDWLLWPTNMHLFPVCFLMT